MLSGSKQLPRDLKPNRATMATTQGHESDYDHAPPPGAVPPSRGSNGIRMGCAAMVCVGMMVIVLTSVPHVSTAVRPMLSAGTIGTLGSLLPRGRGILYHPRVWDCARNRFRCNQRNVRKEQMHPRLPRCGHQHWGPDQEAVPASPVPPTQERRRRRGAEGV